MPEAKKTPFTGAIGFIGFGEAGAAIAKGLAKEHSVEMRAFDLKTTLGSEARQQKLEDFKRANIEGFERAAESVKGARLVFSVVTADQAVDAARRAAKGIGQGCFYFDCNSCAPDTKKQAAAIINRAGGCYVDVAIMGPIEPAQHKTPVLISCEQADEALEVMEALGMCARVVSQEVGAAATIKLIRSVMFKGMEALVAECFLSARKAGVEEEVLASLEKSFPTFGWGQRLDYMLERMIKHGPRRAAEMREAALTVAQLGLNNTMSEAAAAWQQQIGDLGLDGMDEAGFRAQADSILELLDFSSKAE